MIISLPQKPQRLSTHTSWWVLFTNKIKLLSDLCIYVIFYFCLKYMYRYCINRRGVKCSSVQIKIMLWPVPFYITDPMKQNNCLYLKMDNKYLVNYARCNNLHLDILTFMVIYFAFFEDYLSLLTIERQHDT